MEKIRILRVITWLPVGGIERKIQEVLPRLDRDRFEVRVVCLRERGPIADELNAAGIDVDVIPFGTRWDRAATRRLAAYMKQHRIDLVHSHMYRSNVPATMAARKAGIRHVWGQVHNVDTWETWRQAMTDRFVSRWREGMIAVSEKVRQDVIHRLRMDPSKVKIIYNGVDLKRFGKGSDDFFTWRRELRAENGVDNRDVVFLTAARLVEQKRPEAFLRMAGRLQAQLNGAAADGPRPHFWFVGDGPMRKALEEEAAGLPDPGRIKFFGRRDDVYRYMAAAEAYVMPSVREGFSNSLIEALASGLVTIATNVGGNSEAVEDGQSGLIIPAGDDDALDRAAARVLRDDQFRWRISGAARDRARNFSLDRMVSEVEQLYSASVRR